MKKPPTVFIVDDRPVVLSSFETTIKSHDYLVECYSSAEQFMANKHLIEVGCVLIDPVFSTQGGVVLRWLHESDSLLSIVLISGLFESSSAVSKESSSAPIVLRPYEVSALLTMVTDGIAGSMSRQVIRERSRRLKG